MIVRPKLQDIAKQVGVTRMTVSRYFNDPDSVALKTREKIQKAIEDTGFIPTRVPTIMSSSSSRTIGLVIPSFSNGVFSDIIDAVDGSCRQAGYGLLLMHSSYDPKIEEEQVASLLSYQVDSIILCDTVHTELTCKRLQKSGLPVAELLSLTDSPLGINLGIDYEQVFYDVTKSIIESGRKHPAYFGVRMDPRTIIRRNGYLRAIKEAGLKELCFSSSNRSNFTLGRDMMLKALQEHPELDAVLCTNDDVGVGALIACQALNIQVPTQVSVIGCNGLKFCDAAMPKLCSIKTPRYEIAQAGVAEILRQLEAGSTTSFVKKMSCSLLKGGSATEAEQQKLTKLFEN